MLVKIGYFLKPNLSKVIVLVILILMFIPLVAYREPTSKVTWDEIRGMPFPFLMLTEYRGPCPPANTFCVKSSFQELRFIELIKSILFWYPVSCAIVLGYETLREQRKQLGS